MKNTNEINSSNEVVDAWGNPIIYQYPGFYNKTFFDLSSKGKNFVSDLGLGDDITNFSKN